MPVYATYFMVMALSSMGLPLLNGFIGEFTILQGAFARSFWWAFFASLGIVLGAAYLLWLYQRVFWGKITNPENEHLHDLDARELGVLVPLVVLCFWIGLYPKPFLDYLHKPMGQLADTVQPGRFTPGVAHAQAEAPAAETAAPTHP
jgi:NADH-quinone oxidoreductase subunit M